MHLTFYNPATGGKFQMDCNYYRFLLHSLAVTWNTLQLHIYLSLSLPLSLFSPFSLLSREIEKSIHNYLRNRPTKLTDQKQITLRISRATRAKKREEKKSRIIYFNPCPGRERERELQPGNRKAAKRDQINRRVIIGFLLPSNVGRAISSPSRSNTPHRGNTFSSPGLASLLRHATVTLPLTTSRDRDGIVLFRGLYVASKRDLWWSMVARCGIQW